MGDAFDAESGQDHELDNVYIEILQNDQFVTDLTINCRLADTAAEMKREIINTCTKAPLVMKNHINDCDLFYVDDNKKERIPDAQNLLKYEESLSCLNSKLQVAYPRCRNPQQPVQQLEGFGVTKKEVNQ